MMRRLRAMLHELLRMWQLAKHHTRAPVRMQGPREVPAYAVPGEIRLQVLSESLRGAGVTSPRVSQIALASTLVDTAHVWQRCQHTPGMYICVIAMQNNRSRYVQTRCRSAALDRVDGL